MSAVATDSQISVLVGVPRLNALGVLAPSMILRLDFVFQQDQHQLSVQ